MPGGFLDIFECGAILQCRGDERGAHRVRRVAPHQADASSIFPKHAINGIRVQLSNGVERLGIAPQRPEHRTAMVIAMASKLQIGADARGRLRINGQHVSPAALSGNPQRIEPSILMQVAHGEGGDLGAA